MGHYDAPNMPIDDTRAALRPTSSNPYEELASLEEVIRRANVRIDECRSTILESQNEIDGAWERYQSLLIMRRDRTEEYRNEAYGHDTKGPTVPDLPRGSFAQQRDGGY